MRTTIGGVLILSLAIARLASANPVTLTSGGIYTYWDGSSTGFGFAGSGFAASGVAPGGGIFAYTFHVGDTVDLSNTFFVETANTVMTNGSVTTGGQTVQGFFHGRFQFTATPFVVGLQSAQDGFFHTPFSGQGLVQLFLRPDDPQPLISQEVMGSGLLSLPGRPILSEPDVFLANMGVMTLDFKPAPSTTPEPTSLLLLATGLAPLLLSRRRKDR